VLKRKRRGEINRSPASHQLSNTRLMERRDGEIRGATGEKSETGNLLLEI